MDSMTRFVARIGENDRRRPGCRNATRTRPLPAQLLKRVSKRSSRNANGAGFQEPTYRKYKTSPNSFELTVTGEGTSSPDSYWWETANSSTPHGRTEHGQRTESWNDSAEW